MTSKPGLLARLFSRGNKAPVVASLAAAVLNHPATGVAWLANRLAQWDEQLDAGQVVLAGSFTRPVTAQAGDSFHVDYGPLGSIAWRFA